MKASCSVSAKMSDSEENLPSDIELAAQSAIDTLIPAKSKERYEIVYKYFEEWMEIKKIREVSEKVVLAYFCGTIREAKTILLMVPVYYVADDGVD
jgi:predicted metal-dependent RNase